MKNFFKLLGNLLVSEIVPVTSVQSIESELSDLVQRTESAIEQREAVRAARDLTMTRLIEQQVETLNEEEDLAGILSSIK